MITLSKSFSNNSDPACYPSWKHMIRFYFHANWASLQKNSETTFCSLWCNHVTSAQWIQMHDTVLRVWHIQYCAKVKKLYPLTLKVSRYCLLTSQSSIIQFSAVWEDWTWSTSSTHDNPMMTQHNNHIYGFDILSCDFSWFTISVPTLFG